LEIEELKLGLKKKYNILCNKEETRQRNRESREEEERQRRKRKIVWRRHLHLHALPPIPQQF
jgi:FtsZ-binding cell division protein ZapB